MVISRGLVAPGISRPVSMAAIAMKLVKLQIQIWILAFLCARMKAADSNHTYLYGAHPEGGVWGAKVDINTGESELLYNIGYLGAPYEVGTVSYDSFGKQVLLEYFSPHRLDHGPLCRNPPNESFTLTNITKFPIYKNGVTDCLECRASSFAYYENRVYFLMVGDFGPYPNLTKRLELRVLEPCENCDYDIIHRESLQVFSTPFLFNCSTVLAEIYSDVEYPGVEIRLKAGRSMKITPSKDSKPGFFFQVFVGLKRSHRAHLETRLNLYHVTPDLDVLRLHEEKIHWRYSQWNIRAVASVDYMEGILCWTAGDRLYCGELWDKELKHVHLLLYPAEAVAAQVCTGHKLDLLAILTGVSIARTDTEKVVFFGCFSSWPGLGGTGLVKMAPDWSDKEVLPVKDMSNVTRLAGSVFAADVIPSLCPITEKPPQICPTPPPAYALDEPSEQKEPGPGPHIEVVEVKEGVLAEHGAGHAASVRPGVGVLVSCVAFLTLIQSSRICS